VTGGATPLLRVEGLAAAYGHIEALKPTSFEVKEGALVVVLGPNGAGKSTLMRALMGLVESRGDIWFGGAAVAGWSTRRRAEAGLVLVPEGRGILGPLTVQENLELGAYGRVGRVPKPEIAADFESVYALFPRLKERRRQHAGSLSGGEQQMLAVGRALMAKPRLLLLDEPSLGLAPRVVGEIFEALRTLKRGGLTILLVEQKAPLALAMAERAYVLRTGRVVASEDAAALAQGDALARLYLGG
jgi:branched-chain amino acid transport system ATP-binding protein